MSQTVSHRLYKQNMMLTAAHMHTQVQLAYQLALALYLVCEFTDGRTKVVLEESSQDDIKDAGYAVVAELSKAQGVEVAQHTG